MYGDITRNEKVAFHWLLYLDVVRGEHSTGVCAVHKTKDDYSTHVYKELGRPEELYDTYEETFKDDIYQPLSPLLLLGHNRYATQGKIVKETAHPFEYKNVVGAHNGTVWQYSISGLSGAKKWDIDSQIIYQHINDTGNVQEVWDKADGAMALTWWDKKDQTLKVARNNQRPLHWTVSKDQRTLFWASKPWMLEVALDKAGIKYEKIESFPVDTLFTISLNEQNQVCANKEKLNPFVKKVGFLGYTGGNQTYSYSSSSLEKSWFLLKEYVKEGLKQHQGYFVGHIKGDPKEEIIISIDSPVENIQEARYSRIMSHWEEQSAKKLPAMYSFCEEDLDVDHNYWKIEEWVITKLYNNPSINSKTIPANTIEIDGELLDQKQFDWDYKKGCCLCGTCVSFEEAKTTALFIKDELICKDCKNEEFVQEWLAMDKGKVA